MEVAIVTGTIGIGRCPPTRSPALWFCRFFRIRPFGVRPVEIFLKNNSLSPIEVSFMTINAPIKIKVILASIRRNRFGDKPAHWICSETGKKENVLAELLDLRDYPMPFFDDPIPPAMQKGPYSNEMVRKWAAKIEESDAFIIVTPEYNHGYPGVLKNALDSICPEWINKPVGFVGYGNSGGARSIEQLRQVAIELQMVPIKNALHLPVEVYLAVMNEKVPANPELFKPLRQSMMGDRVESFFKELIGMAKTMQYAKRTKD
jgi:NAD(P)H-dependent FMN reductase